MRFDQALALRRLCASRQRAKMAVLAGLAMVNGREERNPSREVTDTDALSLREDESLRYVGRGALKLLHALDAFQIDVTGLRCLDVGASTGGFTQVLLEHGAAQVTAVDVGTAQLAQSLCNDPRVVSLERMDIRSLDLPRFDFICADVSFISLKLILPRLFLLLKDGGAAVCLIKPQFELGPGQVSRRGVVRDPKARARAVNEVCAAAVAEGFVCCGQTQSSIAGGDGNIEYLLHLRKGGAT